MWIETKYFILKLSTNNTKSPLIQFSRCIHSATELNRQPLWNFILLTCTSINIQFDKNHVLAKWNKNCIRKAAGKKRRKAKKTCIMLYSLHQNQFDISAQTRITWFFTFSLSAQMLQANSCRPFSTSGQRLAGDQQQNRMRILEIADCSQLLETVYSWQGICLFVCSSI